MAICKNVLKIREFMQNILSNYAKLRGKTIGESHLFWSAVIISASDESQKQGYEKQINEKHNRKEIPSNVPFHVFADPPGYKIGCGGSTMYVLDELSKIYKNDFQKMRILLIPSGGYSQRLPNLSALGKLFCHLPFGDTSYQMLDLILASYLPFLKNMPPGVFLVSSDAIISYNLNDEDTWSFKNEGFTALAHPSPISVGLNHGVYILPAVQKHCASSTFMSDCLRVLQKPSIREMHEREAVVNINCGEGDQEVIFSDSSFFFDHKIVQKLIHFYNSNKPLTYEFSSYGDFLQPLGINASAYIGEEDINGEHALKKSALYNNLHGTNISILVLKNSYFHHLGTMKDYLDSFCFQNKFSELFPVSKFSFSCWSTCSFSPQCIEGTIIHSIIHPMSSVEKGSIIEYCDINVAMKVGKNCLVSNVQITNFSAPYLPFTNIPDNTLIYTATVVGGFVTVACNINDDIKKNYSKDLFEFFGKKIKNELHVNFLTFSEDCNNYSLWNVKLFPVRDCPTKSLIETLEIISCSNEDEIQNLYNSMNKEHVVLLSMSDVLLLKDTEQMLVYQKNLYHKIKQKYS